MQHNGKEIHFERITARTYEVFYDRALIGIVVESPQLVKFYPQPEWMHTKIYGGATKTLAVGAYILEQEKGRS